ncbi:MAG: amidophosphoribosyltransferase [Flavobacteriales bacterium]|nr:amidophosphoribosyltransferase [Flavobacteriales bacterium]
MIGSVFQLFYPKVCFACGKPLSKNFEHICLQCRHSLPRTEAYDRKENPIQKMFWGRLPLERATSFLQFQKSGKVQRLIHHFKYKGVKEIGYTLGQMAAFELKEKGFFEGIDSIVPIPIHKLKLKKRGYNQSYFIAEGISDAIQIKIDLELITKEIHTESQTKKSRFKRWQNVDSSFKLNMERIPEYRGKHILLVDDVLTTGSTLEACGSQLLQIPGVKLSLLTMAVAEG